VSENPTPKAAPMMAAPFMAIWELILAQWVPKTCRGASRLPRLDLGVRRSPLSEFWRVMMKYVNVVWYMGWEIGGKMIWYGSTMMERIWEDDIAGYIGFLNKAESDQRCSKSRPVLNTHGGNEGPFYFLSAWWSVLQHCSCILMSIRVLWAEIQQILLLEAGKDNLMKTRIRRWSRESCVSVCRTTAAISTD
jgi:hypothetical protein